MELAIVAGLGLLGYRLAAKGAQSREIQSGPTLLRPDNAYPFQPDTTVATTLDRDARLAGRHVTKATAVIDGLKEPDVLVPFVTNDAKQGYNETYAQRRMEAYTGLDQNSYRPKAERGSLFDPSDTRVAVSSGGAPRYATDAQELTAAIESRAAFAGRYNNVGPTDRVTVGPGLGLDANTPAAGGLHSTWRHLPTEDLNLHRRNNLPNRPNHGAKTTTQRRDNPTLVTTKQDLSNIPRPITATKAAGVQGAMVPPVVELQPVKRQQYDVSHYPAPPNRITAGVAAHPTVPSLRDRRAAELGALPTLGVQSSVHGPAVYEGHGLRDTDREWTQPRHGMPFTAVGGGVYSAPQDCLRDTERDTANDYLGTAFAPGGSYASLHGSARPTDREWATGEHTGAAYATGAYAGPSGTSMDLRETTRDREFGYAQVTGPRTGTALSFEGPSATLREVAQRVPVLAGSRPGAAPTRRGGGYRVSSKKTHAVNRTEAGSMSARAVMPSNVKIKCAGPNFGTGSHGAFTTTSGPRHDPTTVPRNKLPVQNPWAPPKPANQYMGPGGGD